LLDAVAMSTHQLADNMPTHQEVTAYVHRLYGDITKHGWRVRMWHSFGYVEPDSWYETLVSRHITAQCSWIDVGGGTGIFPNNRKHAKTLVSRCAFVVSVDPSSNVHNNTLVHEQAQCAIEHYRSARAFDLATLRMVAEHIDDPDAAIASLGHLVRPGGRVIVYTPHRWSPASIAASLTPFWLHHPITSVLWETKTQDVFPTKYKMNTRSALRALFESGGFKEVAFAYLANCATFQRFRPSCLMELALWRLLTAVGLAYPENTLLGVYEKR
jgi:SAM-dependent methyltransferase